MRLSKDEYYLEIAKQVAMRSTCIRRRYGAVIVKDDRILSTGYNGAPRGAINCSTLNKCYRKENNIPSGSSYELCRSVHAEANSIIHADFSSLRGSTLYLAGFEGLSDQEIDDPKPCTMCQRMIINAGIKEVVTRSGDRVLSVDPSQYIRILDTMITG